MIIRKITIMDQRLMQPHKRMRTTRMPDPALRRIPMMTDPYVGLEIFQLVVSYNIIPVTHQLQHNHVFPMADNEGLLLAERGIIVLIQTVRVLVEKFIFHFVFLESL